MSQRSVTIDVQQLCAWLGLPQGCWPPDHYTLLGLPPGESNTARIENRVHQRLANVRSYQLSNPALATEVMTRLAKAFDCLTDPERKKSYDAAHCPHAKPAAPVVPSHRAPTVLGTTDTDETPAIAKLPPNTSPNAPSPLPVSSKLQWQTAVTAPPPVRGPNSALMNPPQHTSVVTPGADQCTPLPVNLANAQVEQPPLAGLPCASPPSASAFPASESGSFRPIYLTPATLPQLGTRRDIYERVIWTRDFGRIWNRVGKYLRKPRRRLVKAAEETELPRLLHILDELAQDSPDLIGQPGQPGYRVFALTAQEPIAERFNALDDDHRIALALDWSAGRKLLDEYRQHLMQLIKGRRSFTSWQRFRGGVESILAIHGGLVVLGFGLVALLILLAVYVR